MTATREAQLWLAQRVSAMVLALCVAVHLATIVYAVRGGLTAQEILTRVQGHAGWAIFYVVFTFAVAIHATLGLRAILIEWLPLHGPTFDFALAVTGIALAVFGLRAVWAVWA